MVKMIKAISYDKENDILFIHKGFSSDEKFKGNIDAGNFILDISTKERIRGIEIMNAAEFFKIFDIDKKALENISDAEFNAKMTPSGIIVGIILKSKHLKQQIPAKIIVPLEIPITH